MSLPIRRDRGLEKPKKRDENRYKKMPETKKPLWQYCGLEKPEEIDPEVLKKIFSDRVLEYGTLFDYTNNISLQKIRNKVVKISDKMPLFENTLQYGWQEAFKLRETSGKRTIFAIDVNSMFPYTMTLNHYSHPKVIKELKVRLFEDLAGVDNGMVLASFDFSDEFFGKIYPHYFFDVNGRKYFEYKQLDFFWISIPELKAIKPYITNIRLKKAYYSPIDIEHPLAGTIKHFYGLRKEYKGTVYEKIIKKFLVGSHSCTNSREFQYIDLSRFKDFYHVSSYFFSRGFLIRTPEELLYMADFLSEHKMTDKYIPSLTSEIYSKSRVLLLKTIMDLKEKFPSVELCYINIDCIHFSVPDEIASEVKSYLEANYIGNELGQFKIEAIAKYGAWFCPGRYYLLDKDFVLVKQADIAIKGDDFAFNHERKIEIAHQGEIVAHRHTIFSGNNFKHIDVISNDNINFNRPLYGEFFDLEKYKEKNVVVSQTYNYMKRIAIVKDRT
jgi:hypothetical protein